MENLLTQKHLDRKIFFYLLIITFTIFIFTSSAHRFASDDFLAYDQAERIFSQTPIENFVVGETKPGLQGFGFTKISYPPCQNAILCSAAPIGYSSSFIPFIAIENSFNLIPNYEFTESDFDDPHYVFWRNSLSNEETFSFLIYGPLFSALSVSVLFLLTRLFGFDTKIGVSVSLLYAFSTIVFAYSSTGLNVVPGTFVILLAFYFYKKFDLQNKTTDIIFCGTAMGFSLLLRNDFLIFSVFLSVFLLYVILKRNQKLKNLLALFIPILICIIIIAQTNLIEFGSPFLSEYTTEHGIDIISSNFPIYEGIFGLLFSPGAGMFIFSPILFLIFISLFDFYKIDKQSTILILSFMVTIIFFYGSLSTWHGFVSWGDRYLLQITPFLLLTLSASLLKREKKSFYILIFSLASIGFFFNLMWQIQDVSWFVWGPFGGNTGLFSLGIAGMHHLNLNPLVFWTFEHSQLTQSIMLFFNNLQPDLYLFKILGVLPSAIILIAVLTFMGIKLKSLIKTTI